MAHSETPNKQGSRLNFFDTLLYTLAGSAMTIISVTFLLWLRF